MDIFTQTIQGNIKTEQWQLATGEIVTSVFKKERLISQNVVFSSPDTSDVKHTLSILYPDKNNIVLQANVQDIGIIQGGYKAGYSFHIPTYANVQPSQKDPQAECVFYNLNRVGEGYSSNQDPALLAKEQRANLQKKDIYLEDDFVKESFSQGIETKLLKNNQNHPGFSGYFHVATSGKHDFEFSLLNLWPSKGVIDPEMTRVAMVEKTGAYASVIDFGLYKPKRNSFQENKLMLDYKPYVEPLIITEKPAWKQPIELINNKIIELRKVLHL